jgi:hypothetical protein
MLRLLLKCAAQVTLAQRGVRGVGGGNQVIGMQHKVYHQSCI